MSRRHRARRLALQALCCFDVQGRAVIDLLNEFIDDSHEPADTIAAAHEIFNQTLAQREDSDELLVKHARHWELSRLAMIDRNILRLAACELLRAETPFKVVITEALKLAQEFSTAESPRFINGVLDAVAKDLAAQHPHLSDESAQSDVDTDDVPDADDTSENVSE